MDIDKSRRKAKLIRDLRALTGIDYGYQKPAANLLGVSVTTIKRWVRNGAPYSRARMIEVMLRDR